MSENEDELQRSIYKSPSFTGGSLEIRLFYIRIAPCAVDSLPDHLTLYHLRRESGVSLEINGARIPSSNAVSVTLRRDRVDKDKVCSPKIEIEREDITGDALLKMNHLENETGKIGNEMDLEETSKVGLDLNCDPRREDDMLAEVSGIMSLTTLMNVVVALPSDAYLGQNGARGSKQVARVKDLGGLSINGQVHNNTYVHLVHMRPTRKKIKFDK